MSGGSEKADDDSCSTEGAHDEEFGSSDTGGTEPSSSQDKKISLVDKETRYVFYLRLCVLLVLLLAAAVSIVVFFIARNGEDGSFESDYTATANKITETFLDIATEKMGAAGSMVVAIVAHGNYLGTPWPFVTLPSFEERVATVLKLSGALYIGMNPKVTDELRPEWEEYATYSQDAQWYQEALDYQQYWGTEVLDNRPQIVADDPTLNVSSGIANHIFDYRRNTNGTAYSSPKADYYLPIWQNSPVTKRTRVNQNRASNSKTAIRCLEEDAVVFEGMQYSDPGYSNDPNPRTSEIAFLLAMANKKSTEYEGDIFTTVFFPLYDNFSVNRRTVGVMRIVIHWHHYFEGLLPDSTKGVIFVLDNSCDDPFTYQINGANVIPLGHGDLHDPKYTHYERTASFANVTTIADGTKAGMTLFLSECPYSIRVYPSETYYDSYHSSVPTMITCAVAVVFLYTVIIFYIYDRQVEHRQNLLMKKAVKTHKIVASLFPKNVRDRLLEEEDDHTIKTRGLLAPNRRLQTYLGGDGSDNDVNLPPIADLIPHATVLFADISGFTAWSSSREPAQVFILLQHVYQAFDTIAKRRRVFKVETVGDSYVAVTGLPEPQINHAVIMTRFAAECMMRMEVVVQDLETSLGPGTGDLCMRVGMNSGPVTAGVLRGDRSRFQLFGDTMNTASRMESTGVSRKIQVSQSTADLLIKGAKQHWLSPRDDNVVVKGKGVLQTYWVYPRAKKTATSNTSSGTGSSDHADTALTEDTVYTHVTTADLMKRERQIDWVVELLQDSIRQIVAQRQANKKLCKSPAVPHRKDGQIALDEVVEAIKLPEFNADATAAAPTQSVMISEDIVALLREYVAIIASAYRDNPFHNFEHACQVTMSVNKFLKRILTPELEIDLHGGDDDSMAKRLAYQMHDYTHGINSDPITRFALFFSALIHDVDHRGISNGQLMKEEPLMAQMFRSKSVAEQNSLEISWDILMSDRFKDLRNYIFADNEELNRFRQVIVNVVLATDIFDKELNDLRKARWRKAFSETKLLTNDKNALRATIVMEHIIQASDVSHTMQHWHIYRKWNERLFLEMRKAYEAGQMEIDPATFWYKGELGFFDNYIIPLANKLKDCNVFGVSSDECLNYAVCNRAEWEARGLEMVEEMLERIPRTEFQRVTL